MCANSVREAARVSIAVAKVWANDLVLRESRGPGDMENAMHRLEGRYGIPWRTFWSLRYRPPSDLMHSVYERLRAAYLAECERQTRLLQHEIEITRLKAGPHAPAVVAAEALVNQNEAVDE